LNPSDLARITELLALKAEASRADIQRACEQARRSGYRSLWVNGSRVVQALALLEDTDIKLATVVGFPLGVAEADVKRFETEAAVDNGAQEIHVVLNVGWLKDGEGAAIVRELRDIVEAADERAVGVILEMPLLTDTEKSRACELIRESGAKAIVACACFGTGNATIADVRTLRERMGAKVAIIAAGGIADTETALALVEAGATGIAIELPFRRS